MKTLQIIKEIRICVCIFPWTFEFSFTLPEDGVGRYNLPRETGCYTIKKMYGDYVISDDDTYKILPTLTMTLNVCRIKLLIRTFELKSMLKVPVLYVFRRNSSFY